MTNAEARFNNSLRPRKPEGSLGRTAQDVHLDSHTAPELSICSVLKPRLYRALIGHDMVGVTSRAGCVLDRGNRQLGK